MPRTKQTKPRHIVEDQKTNGNPKVEAVVDDCNLKDFAFNRGNNGELSDPDPESPASTSTPTEDLFEQSNISGKIFNGSHKEMESAHKNQNNTNTDVGEVADTESEVEESRQEPFDFDGNASAESLENRDLAKPDRLQGLLYSKQESPESAGSSVATEAFQRDENTFIRAEATSLENSRAETSCKSGLTEGCYREFSSFNDASLAYFASLRNMTQGKSSSDPEINETIWKAILNNSVGITPLGNGHDTNYTNLVKDYVSKLMEGWNSKLKAISKTSFPSSSSEDQDQRAISEIAPVHSAVSGKSYSKILMSSDCREQDSLGENDVPISLSTENKSCEVGRDIQDAQLSNGRHEDRLPRDPPSNMADKSREKCKYANCFDTEKSRVSLSDCASSVEQASTSAFPNYSNFHAIHSSSNLSSAPFFKFGKYGQLPPSSFYSYHPWSNPAWLNYNSHQASPFPGYFSYQHFPYTPADVKDKSLRPRKSFKSREKHGTDLVSTSNKNSKAPSLDSTSPRSYFSSANENLKKTHLRNGGTPLDASQSQNGAPLTGYNSLWFGSQLPHKLVQRPPSYANQVLDFSHKYPGLYYPSEARYATSPRLSPSVESYSTRSPFGGEIDDSLSNSVGKMLNHRRSRAKGPAFDSVHAAIVREAKEQSKGVDPENMYIQCPICQKRIKRLYHFQRHMRIHTGEKTHQCPICQYKSVRKDNLKSHMKTHEKQNSETGKKGTKLTYQNNRYSYVPNEKSPSRSSVLPSSKGYVHSLEASNFIQKSEFDKLKKTQTPSSASPSASSELSSPRNSVENDPQQKSPSISAAQSSQNNYDNQDYNASLNKCFDRLNYIDLAGFSKTNIRPNDEIPLDMQKDKSNSKKREVDFMHSSFESNDEDVESKRQKVDNENKPMSIDSLHETENNNKKRDRIGCSQTNQSPFPFPYSLNSGFRNVPTASDVESTAKPLSGQHLLNNHSEPWQEEAVLRQKLPTRPDSRLHEHLPSRVSEIEVEKSDPSKEEAASFVQTSASGATSVADDCEKQTRAAVDSGHQSDASPTGDARDRFKMRMGGSPYLHSTRKVQENTWKQRNPKSQSDFLRPDGASSDKANQANSDKSFNHENFFSGSADSKSKSFKLKSFQDPSMPSKPLQCRLCTFATMSSVELQSHVTSKHKQDGFYKCEECTYLGKNLSKLVEHIRIHTGERPFKCDQCNYAAKRKDNLAQHKAVRHDKRKAKTASQWVADSKCDSSLSTSTARNLRCLQGSKAPRKGSSSKSHSAVPDHSLLSRLNLHGSFCAKNEEMNKLAAAASLMTPFHSIPAINSLPPGLFQFPFYHHLPPVIKSSDLESSMPVTAPRTVNSQGSYSMSARPALIAP